jgi:hypothetical protein
MTVEMTNDKELVMAHINMMQAVVSRMAKNSENCKVWCLTLLAGILGFSAQLQKPHLAWSFIIPLISFMVLDGYYLSMERELIALQKSFLEKYANNQLKKEDLFKIEMNSRRGTLGILSGIQCLTSPSIYIFYIMLAIAVWAIIK